MQMVKSRRPYIKLFRSFCRSRYMHNRILAFRDNNSINEDVMGIKNLAFNHFRYKYYEPSFSRHKFDEVKFNTLSPIERSDLK